MLWGGSAYAARSATGVKFREGRLKFWWYIFYKYNFLVSTYPHYRPKSLAQQVEFAVKQGGRVSSEKLLSVGKKGAFFSYAFRLFGGAGERTK